MGLRTRLLELNQERDLIVKALENYEKKSLRNEIVEHVRASNKKGFKYKKHWTQTAAGRKRLAAQGRKMWKAKQSGYKQE